ncbi:MAG: hypothetical protein Q7S59_08245, partial [Sulfurimonas sp.]|nr:hypothetical protein [Sulfurimonas sp.]
MFNMKVKSQLYMLLTLLVIGFSTLLYTSMLSVNNTRMTNERLVLIGQFESIPAKIMMNLVGYQLLFKEDFIKAYDKEFKDFSTVAEELHTIVLAEENRMRIKEISALIKEWSEINVPRVAMLKQYQRKITDDAFTESENGLKLAVLTKKSADIFKIIETKTTTLKESVIKVNIDNAENIFKISIVSITLMTLITIIFVLFLIKNIISRISTIQLGLTSFFSFLNRETSKAEPINLDSKDEFGQMAV